MADREKKKGDDENTKTSISQERKESFFDEIKNIFDSY